MTKYIHDEVIRAWLDGKTVQKRVYDEWIDLVPCSGLDQVHSFYAVETYRIKPEVIKYRRFLWKSVSTGKYCVCIASEEEQLRENFPKWHGFIRWIDNDWQEEVI